MLLVTVRPAVKKGLGESGKENTRVRMIALPPAKPNRGSSSDAMDTIPLLHPRASAFRKTAANGLGRRHLAVANFDTNSRSADDSPLVSFLRAKGGGS